MDKTLRILILEDNRADAELIQFELEEGGVAFAAKVVATEEAFLHELGAFSPDIILSDYDLPRYTGAFALAEARSRCPDVPFILVTGAVTEERAIEILTGGAKDYVMKSRLGRLVPAVRRALAEAGEHRARKTAEEEVRAASLYTRSLIEASLDPLVTISPDGKVMDVNRATEEITGVSREQIIGTDFADYFTEPEKARAGYERAFSTGSVKDYPLALRHVSGRATEVLYNATTYANEAGEIKGVFAAARDVTELKRAEEELREAQRSLEDKVRERTAALEEEKERLAAVINSIQDEVWFADAQKRFTLANPAALEEFHLHPGNGVTVEGFAAGLEVYRPDGSIRPVEEAPPLRALQGEVVRNQEEIIRTPASGALRYRQVSASPVRDARGGIVGSVSVVRDITEEKRMAEEIGERVRQLEAAGNGGERFSGAAAHDLCAPLRTIDGCARTLLEKQGAAIDPETRTQVDLIRDSAGAMGRLIEALLAGKPGGRGNGETPAGA